MHIAMLRISRFHTRWFASFLWCCFLSLAAKGSSLARRPFNLQKITIAVVPRAGSAAPYGLDEKGFFKREGLAVTIRKYIAGQTALAAAFTVKVDFGTVAEKPVSAVVTIGLLDEKSIFSGKKGMEMGKIGNRKGNKGWYNIRDDHGIRTGFLPYHVLCEARGSPDSGSGAR
jgi:ABC-type nitrate/sulfonate/bicarbonate transport system substrate-binding protein